MVDTKFAPTLVPPTPTVVETLVKHLRHAIISGALPGGTPIRQEEMSRKFGVSRVPLREALLRLEGEGLVETQPRRGVVVTALSPDDFEEILEMRYALESLAIERAAQRFTEKDLKAALHIVEEAEAAIASANPLDLRMEFESRWGDMNWAFHKCLYLPAQRGRLLADIENLHNLFARHVRMRIEAGARVDDVHESPEETFAANIAEWKAVIAEHRDMALACGRRDAEAAKRILKVHISDHGAELVRRIQNPQ